jgi:hypothetical protein
MTDKIVIVTPPDDILTDGVRVLLFDLVDEQTAILSDALKQLRDTTANAIVYSYNSLNENIDWLIEKKQKSDLIIFNANSTNDLMVGYLAAQPNSYYFGTLRSLQTANNCAIYNTDQAIQLLETTLTHYEIR